MPKWFFILHKDKVYKNDYGYATWVEAGPYKVIRFFDNDRVLVDLRKDTSFIAKQSKKRELTLLSLDNGELIEGDIKDVR